jgi:hypothetical protein
MDKWHLLFVLMVLSTCLVCQHASAQDNAARTKIFLDVDMKQSPVRQPHHGPEATQHMRSTTVSPPVLLPFHINALQYISEKQGKIPVISGMDGKLQLEFGLFGYLGVKFNF